MRHKQRMRMLESLLEVVRFRELEHCKAARELFSRQHPSWRICETKVVSKETNRCIVAVFYEEPGVFVKPLRYALLAVPHDLSSVETLNCAPESKYWLKGRK